MARDNLDALITDADTIAARQSGNRSYHQRIAPSLDPLQLLLAISVEFVTGHMREQIT